MTKFNWLLIFAALAVTVVSTVTVPVTVPVTATAPATAPVTVTVTVTDTDTAKATVPATATDSQLDLRLSMISAELHALQLIERANAGTLDEQGRERLGLLLRRSNEIHQLKTLRLLSKLEET